MIDRPFRVSRAPEWVHVAIAILLLTAAVAALTLSQSQQDRVFRGQNDFLQLYSGAKLVGSVGLYSPEAVKRIQESNAGLWLRGVYYSRPPFYALLLNPLASFSYLQAYWIFQSINLACLAVIVCLFFLRHHPSYLTWLPLFLPLLISFTNGQDVVIVMMFCALFLVLSDRGHDLAAGACLSVCLIKFHLFVFVPVAVLGHRRWRILLGGIGGSAFWVCVSFAVQGWHWPASYFRALLNPDLHPGQDRMPTVLSALRTLGVDGAAAAFIFVVFALLFLLAILRTRTFERSVALALVAGIVLSVHAYTHDCALLLLSIPLLSGASGISAWLRAALLTPVPYLGTLYGGRWNVILPLGLILFSAVTWHASWRKPARVSLSDSSLNGDPCATR